MQDVGRLGCLANVLACLHATVPHVSCLCNAVVTVLHHNANYQPLMLPQNANRRMPTAKRQPQNANPKTPTAKRHPQNATRKTPPAKLKPQNSNPKTDIVSRGTVTKTSGTVLFPLACRHVRHADANISYTRVDEPRHSAQVRRFSCRLPSPAEHSAHHRLPSPFERRSFLTRRTIYHWPEGDICHTENRTICMGPPPLKSAELGRGSFGGVTLTVLAAAAAVAVAVALAVAAAAVAAAVSVVMLVCSDSTGEE